MSVGQDMQSRGVFWDAIERCLDSNSDRCLSRLTRFVRTPTDVPIGQTELDPTDPKIAHYIADIVAPEVEALHPRDLIIDEYNNLICRFGRGESPATVLMVGYAVSQHANKMADPYSARIANAKSFGFDEDCVFGRGASQNKGSLAAALAALEAVDVLGVDLPGTVWFAVNTEGRSSHSMMQRILNQLPIRPQNGILCVGTDNRVSLGNRGRVDVRITLSGKSVHSSTPWLGANAIEGAAAVVQRLQRIPCTKCHSSLGRTQITVYNMAFSPIAPHTLPDMCAMIVDRRLLPGETVEDAIEEIQRAVAPLPPFEICVEQGACMFPAEVQPNDFVVRAIDKAHRVFTDSAVETFYPHYTFDAGYPCQAGIPTVMFGPSSGTGSDVGDEFVSLSQVGTAAKIYTGAISLLAGNQGEFLDVRAKGGM